MNKRLVCTARREWLPLGPLYSIGNYTKIRRPVRAGGVAASLDEAGERALVESDSTRKSNSGKVFLSFHVTRDRDAFAYSALLCLR